MIGFFSKKKKLAEGGTRDVGAALCVVHTVPPSVTPTLGEQGGLPVVSLIPVAWTEVCPRLTNYLLVCTPRAS